jgi:hypothetical protein
MDERLRFVARLLEGEKMAPLCAEFGISRKTGSTATKTAESSLSAIGAKARTGTRIGYRRLLKRRSFAWSGSIPPKIRERRRQKFYRPTPPDD